jgi:hypothetical protein
MSEEAAPVERTIFIEAEPETVFGFFVDPSLGAVVRGVTPIVRQGQTERSALKVRQVTSRSPAIVASLTRPRSVLSLSAAPSKLITPV